MTRLPMPCCATLEKASSAIFCFRPTSLIITVRRPHRQRMSSAVNALLCNIGEGKQCNLLSYFSALQHLCGTLSCGKRARKGHFHGHEHTCTHTGRQSASHPHLPHRNARQHARPRPRRARGAKCKAVASARHG